MDILTWLTQLDPNSAIPGVSSLGLIGFVVVCIIKGWLVPRNVLVDRIADKDKAIDSISAERDTWREAYDKSEEARKILAQQNSDLIDSGKTTNHLIESLRNYLERGDTHA